MLSPASRQSIAIAKFYADKRALTCCRRSLELLGESRTVLSGTKHTVRVRFGDRARRALFSDRSDDVDDGGALAPSLEFESRRQKYRNQWSAAVHRPIILDTQSLLRP